MAVGKRQTLTLDLAGTTSKRATSKWAANSPGSAGVITNVMKWTIPSGMAIKLGPDTPRPRLYLEAA